VSVPAEMTDAAIEVRFDHKTTGPIKATKKIRDIR
jgi:hypothetical protein